MSANKMTDTKIPEDENLDSGILSGPIYQYPDEREEADSEVKVSSISASAVQPGDIDSGYIDISEECLSSKLSGVTLGDSSTDPRKLFATLEQTENPPVVLFFQQDSDGDTQLHIASVHGCEKAVSTLLKICPNKDLLDVANDDGHTPLHLAVMSGNAVVAKMLVIAGLSLGVRDRTGETPIHKATAAGHVECLHALLHPVPEHPPRNLSTVLNQKNYNGQASVHLAANAGHYEALKTLVYYGADINAKEHLAGWTALHIAARRADTRLVSYLLERGAGEARRARDYAGRTPRRLARHTLADKLFNKTDDDDSDTDSEDDMYDSDCESLFERLRDTINPYATVA